MPYKLRKNEENLVSKWKLFVGGNHYFHIFLWKTHKDMEENTIGCCNKTKALINFNKSLVEFKFEEDGFELQKTEEKEITKPKLGELHFVKSDWNLEIIAHELCHALIHRLRVVNPLYKQMVLNEELNEEDICHEYGMWMIFLYSEFQRLDPKGEIGYE